MPQATSVGWSTTWINWWIAMKHTARWHGDRSLRHVAVCLKHERTRGVVGRSISTAACLGVRRLQATKKNHCEGRSNLLSSLAFVRRVRSAGTFASGGRRTTRNVRYNGPAHLPSKCPFPLGIYNLRLTHGSLGCPPLTASRSVQPFSHNSSVYTHKHTQTYRQTHRPRYVRHL